MMVMENLRMAVASLKANKSRALLTMLGIIIGIAAVIAIMTVGNSVTNTVSTSMQDMGANNINVMLTRRENEPEKREDGIRFGAEESRKEQIVQSAISTLSFSELEAIVHIFDELDGTEGILVASKIADRVGITRSIIVNALRKIESAGVIESRSSGMRGTYIKVINDFIFDEVAAIKKRKAE